MKPSPNTESTPKPIPTADWLESVRRHVASLRYGVVQVTVHGGKVVQVERTERFRFETPATHTGNGQESPV